MLHLRKVISKIPEKDAKEILFWLEQNEAERCVQLFYIYRESKLEESEIAESLQLNPPSFYTLKSRLNRRIQEYFAHNVPDSNIDLLRNIANIPNLLYNSPRELATTHLLKLEKELIKHDMPYALTAVYSALKKLNRYSQKYFEYTQQYNKHLAYTMANDKAKELLSDFNKTLGEYLMSHDKKMLHVLRIIQQEMHNYAQLYESHRLMVYKNILDAEFMLFTGDREDISGVVEEILGNAEKIITSYKYDTTYRYQQTILNFLWFEYYHRTGLHKKATQYFNAVNEKLSSLLQSNFCCFPSAFLLSKTERYVTQSAIKKLYKETHSLSASFSPDPEDVPNYINHIKSRAIAALYAKKYAESVSVLNDLMNTVSFRNFLYAEVEIKLFLTVCYLLNDKYDQADTLLKNVQRRLRDCGTDEYKNAYLFTKMIAVIMDPNSKKNKWIELRNKFELQNKGAMRMLSFMPLNDIFLKALFVKKINDLQ